MEKHYRNCAVVIWLGFKMKRSFTKFLSYENTVVIWLGFKMKRST